MSSKTEDLPVLNTPVLRSRLPEVGTTIFTVMSALATEHQSVNLGQGFPDFACDPALLDAVSLAMHQGHNQYPPMAGVLALREAVADKMQRLYGHSYRAADEITITAGATQAIISIVLAVVHPGDEVIVLEPCYDSYLPNIALAGGVAVPVPLTPGTFRPDFDKIAAAMTPRTRCIIINSPHNPSGTIWSRADMLRLQEILAPTNVLLISDEVYEHMVYDGAPHESAARYPGLAARSFIVSSFGKTYHVTGWKTGYCVAPAVLTAELRRVHQFVTFVGITPIQFGLADFMRDHPEHLRELPAFYQRKRDLFVQALAGSRFRTVPSAGTYFQLADYSAISDLSDVAFAEWLTRHVGVAAIPVSVFYAQAPAAKYVRFCFCKNDDTLREAAARLAAL